MKHIEIRENLHVLTLRCKGLHFASNWLTGGSGLPNQSQSHENQNPLICNNSQISFNKK